MEQSLILFYTIWFFQINTFSTESFDDSLVIGDIADVKYDCRLYAAAGNSLTKTRNQQMEICITEKD